MAMTSAMTVSYVDPGNQHTLVTLSPFERDSVSWILSRTHGVEYDVNGKEIRVLLMAAHQNIMYSDKYFDDVYEYRHVMLAADLAELVPRNHLMTETEWRNLGVLQSPFWLHYMVHTPEPHILLYRRPLRKQPTAENE